MASNYKEGDIIQHKDKKDSYFLIEKISVSSITGKLYTLRKLDFNGRYLTITRDVGEVHNTFMWDCEPVDKSHLLNKSLVTQMQ